MSAGCIPDKAQRKQALDFARTKVKEAAAILDALEHPDDDPRAMERASGLLLEARGDYCDKSEPLALDDLCEHYFS